MNSYLQSIATNIVSNGHSHFQSHVSSLHGATLPFPAHAHFGRYEQKEQRTYEAVAPVAPITEFNLPELGVDLDRLVANIGPSFEHLTLDIYEKRRQEVEFLKVRFPEQGNVLDAFFFDYLTAKSTLTDISQLISTLSATELELLEHVGAIRHRAIARFEVQFNNSSAPAIKRVAADGFVQKTSKNSDFRALPRYFAEASNVLTDNSDVCQILRFVAMKVKSQHRTTLKNIVLTLHQVIVTVNSETPFVLPDGIHQDGADYIVSAIPIIMNGVVAPLSTVYDSQLNSVLETRLAVGQGLLHDDRSYWHSVSTLLSTGCVGQRGTLGLDVQLQD